MLPAPEVYLEMLKEPERRRGGECKLK